MLEYLGAIVDFMFTGIYDFFVDVTSYWIQVSVKWSLYMAYNTLQFSWEIAKDILNDLNINQTLATAWASLDSATLETALFFKLPQAVGNLTAAFVTKFVYKTIGGVALI